MRDNEWMQYLLLGMFIGLLLVNLVAMGAQMYAWRQMEREGKLIAKEGRRVQTEIYRLNEVATNVRGGSEQ